ncbi:hypothetical protein PGT21_023473 [Puccinia graminis f. sp. tritici]|uniref:Uncharacterized protein n=1 Tax=Puccinia graminis f. sp. tritici TaxID=56615 RepID=A0A5B0MFG0_PUCGR|nr:hypothetical protein PGT21_023473 [Puccinia graminis f. sp. tritici]
MEIADDEGWHCARYEAEQKWSYFGSALIWETTQGAEMSKLLSFSVIHSSSRCTATRLGTATPQAQLPRQSRTSTIMAPTHDKINLYSFEKDFTDLHHVSNCHESVILLCPQDVGI